MSKALLKRGRRAVARASGLEMLESRRLMSASLSGTVFSDTNGNGVQEAGEDGIAGVTMQLIDNNTGQYAQIITTAADGTYTFNVAPGFYAISEVNPSGYSRTINTAGTLGGLPYNTIPVDGFDYLSVADGVHATGYNFGEIGPAKISGYVYYDSNNNGVKEAGETGISSMQLHIFGLDNGLDIFTATTTGGAYTINNLAPGTYQVSVFNTPGIPNGNVSLGNLGGVAGLGYFQVTVGTGQSASNYNFAKLLDSTVSGTVYTDQNNNGILDAGEAPIGGVTVTLNGTDIYGDIFSASLTTAADGTYNFGGLKPGDYVLVEAQPAGYLDGTANPGSIGGVAVGSIITGIHLQSGVPATAYNFGELLPSSIGGKVYIDANNNGVNDAGEIGIEGVVVTLTGTDDHGAAVTASLVTATDGTYTFGGLRPGTYSVIETQSSDFLDNPDVAGTAGGVVGNDVVSGITLGAGVSATGYVFGELTPSALQGIVYLDLNSNGVINVNEAGIAGVTVNLTGVDDHGVAVSATVITDSDGSYVFDGLRPGTYSVTEIQPAGYLDGAESVGSLGGTVGADKFSGIVISANSVGINYNFAERSNVVTPPVLAPGMTATVGFWTNSSGQALIKALNGSASSKALGNWAATTFPRLFGNFSVFSLAGKTNAQVATTFQVAYLLGATRVEANAMALAFAMYVTDTDLAGGNYAAAYGFTTNTSGTAAATYNVGNSGTALGFANNSSHTILEILHAIENRSLLGLIVVNRSAINSLLVNINNAGH